MKTKIQALFTSVNEDVQMELSRAMYYYQAGSWNTAKTYINQIINTRFPVIQEKFNDLVEYVFECANSAYNTNNGIHVHTLEWARTGVSEELRGYIEDVLEQFDWINDLGGGYEYSNDHYGQLELIEQCFTEVLLYGKIVKRFVTIALPIIVEYTGVNI